MKRFRKIWGLVYRSCSRSMGKSEEEEVELLIEATLPTVDAEEVVLEKAREKRPGFFL